VTANAYETDIVAWADEQARLLRAGLFSRLDIEHIAEEIEDVGKSERRELRSRMVLLLAHLLKWRHQPERRGNSWRRTIKAQRKGIVDCIDETPSLKADLQDPRWRDRTWNDTISAVFKEVEIEDLPETCPWTMAEILDPAWLPEDI
jgi:hypothetical protein